MKIPAIVGLALGMSMSAFADVSKDFEGLGGNKILMLKAQEFNPEQEVSIVQERTVSRRNRIELAPEYMGAFGGDTYTRSQAVGMNLHYHITPRWSVGLKYLYNFNQLTPEGKAMVGRAAEEYQKDPANPSAPIPNVVYPKEEMFASLCWYPIYGKMNLFNLGVAHFDFYALASYGQVVLSSGAVPSYVGGGGFGFWWTQHFSSRVEMRYQTYTAKYFDSNSKMDLAVASVQLGWLL